MASGTGSIATTQKVYNDPNYTVHKFNSGTVAAGTLTPRHYLVAPTPINVYQAYAVVTTAGSVGTGALDAVVVSGTTTTTYTGPTLSTATQTAGVAVQVDLTTGGTLPTAIAAGGYAYLQTRLDATVTLMAAWEWSLQSTANLVGPT